MPKTTDNIALCTGYNCNRASNCERYIKFREVTKRSKYLKFDPTVTFMSSIYNPASDYCSKQIPLTQTTRKIRNKR